MSHTQANTWFGVITEPGRPRALTAAIGLLVSCATVASVLFPALGSWIFISTGLVAAFWYTHMMRRWQERR